MLGKYFITGTDTGIGKTIASSWLVSHMDAQYWKPVQSGVDEPTDTQIVKDICSLGDRDVFPERYRLSQPLSPHESARRDGVSISLDDFSLPETDRNLVVEGAGGVMVPLNDSELMIDLMVRFDLPVIIVVKSGLGTINHSLLTIEALRKRDIYIHGVIISGEKNEHNKNAILKYGQVDLIAELGFISDINKDNLLAIKPEKEI